MPARVWTRKAESSPVGGQGDSQSWKGSSKVSPAASLKAVEAQLRSEGSDHASRLSGTVLQK